MADIKRKTGVVDYVLNMDRDLPPEYQTTFKVKGLTNDDYEQVHNMIGRGDNASALAFAGRRGCVGWDNLYSDGKRIEFQGRLYPKDTDKLKRCRPEEIELLPLEIWEEIGAHVVSMSVLEVAEKN